MLAAGPPIFPSLPLPLADAELACFGIDLKEHAEDWWTAALPWASAGEQARARRFHRRMDALRHVVGRALVRSLLSREFGVAAASVEFVANPWGKPALPGCGIEFNISHSGDAVWVALCRGIAVGIDVESGEAVADPQGMAQVFHPAERAALGELPPADAQGAFLRCWARKEAVIKALGEGLSRPLTSFRVRTGECAGGWLVEAPEGGGMGWTVADLPPLAGCRASVAAMAPGLAVTCHYGGQP